MTTRNDVRSHLRRATIGALAAVVALGPCAGPATHARDRRFEEVAPAEKLIRAERKIPGRYLVLFHPSASKADVSFDAFSERLTTAYGGTLDRAFESISACSVEMGEQQVRTLSRDPSVKLIVEDELLEITETQANAPWGLDRIDQRDRPLDTDYRFEATGAGVSVYVIDTGIRSSHDEFSGRVATRDFIDDDGNIFTAATSDSPSGNDGEDCQGHGTHVAGTIGGSTFGVAKDVRIVALRALGRNREGQVVCGSAARSGSLTEIIDAVNWVTLNHRKPAVANMSLGGGANVLLDLAVQASILAGVTYVVSAGNDSVDAANSSPARVAEAITVGATDATDRRASFSNFGSVVDLFAPGDNILSADIGSDTDSSTKDGTSMAAPHVAGVAALLLEGSSNATPAEVHAAMVSTFSTSGRVTNPGASTTTRLLNTSETLTPLAPENLTATRSGLLVLSTVTLGWDDVADNETEYRVFRRTSSGFVQIQTLPAGSTSATIAGVRLRLGSRATFAVQAANANGVSELQIRTVRAPRLSF